MLLKSLLNDVAIDIQHVGSTAIPNVWAKPIIDIIVGVETLDSIKPCIELLDKNGIVFRKGDVKGQFLFVTGDFEKECRTHLRSRTPIFSLSIQSAKKPPFSRRKFSRFFSSVHLALCRKLVYNIMD